MWQVRIEVTDVTGAPGAVLELSACGSTGDLAVRAPGVAAIDELPVADTGLNVVVSISYPRLARLVVNLVRGPRETSWRWTEAGLRVTTQIQRVTVGAVLSRVRPALLITMPEADLMERAEQTKALLDAAVPRTRKNPPETARIDALPGMLRENQGYRHTGAPEERVFHILAAEPLADARQKDWP